jgi:thiol-disulfide isomerase/thioredoxin
MSRLSRVAFAVAGSAALIAPWGCKGDDATSLTPDNFLRASMDHYQGLGSYEAAWTWQFAEGPSVTVQQRSLQYSKPNIYKYSMTMNMPKGDRRMFEVSSVSDGTQTLDSSNQKGVDAMLFPAASLADTPTLQGVLGHMKTGLSPVLLLFGGSSYYSSLVDDSTGKPSYAKEENVSGETARHVLFFSRSFGHVDLLIGEKTYDLYRAAYDLAPMVQGNPKLKGLLVTESYSKIQDNPSFAVDNFKVSPPQAHVLDRRNPNAPAPPVAEGDPAPDFAVHDVKSGKSLNLSSLRGKPVMIDFWATWCGPCKASLPHTEQIYKQYGDKLHVMTVSDEDVSKIEKFNAANGYDYPAYQDAQHDAMSKYNVKGIPCVIIVDSKGNMSSYIVGAVPEDVLMQALKKVSIG